MDHEGLARNVLCGALSINNMEALVFAIVAVRNGYHREDIFVSEPNEFRPFVFES